jgi:hypothetical protein
MVSSSSSAIGYSSETGEVPVYLETYPVSRLDDDSNSKNYRLTLYLAFVGFHWGDLAAISAYVESQFGLQWWKINMTG